MKKIALTTITLSICLAMSGQQVSKRLNDYRNEEMLTKQRVEINIDELLASKGKWSMEGAEIGKKKYKCSYIMQTDTLAGRERGQRTNFQESRSQMDIIGSENYMELMSYDRPETWLNFPMNLGDSISGYFSGTGPYCERLLLRRFGTYLTKADAVGSLTLPQGNTLRNVLRLHTERNFSSKVAPIGSVKSSTDAFTEDSIVSFIAEHGAPLREDIYRWYAEGYRYPVLEARTLTVKDERTLEEVFYCAPEVQEALPYDAENDAERQRSAAEQAAKTRGTNNYVYGFGNYAGHTLGGISYTIKQSSGNGLITICYNAIKDVKLVSLVSNSQGYIFKRAEQFCAAGSGQFAIDCADLHRGQYILYINVDGEQAAEKVNLR